VSDTLLVMGSWVGITKQHQRALQECKPLPTMHAYVRFNPY